MATHIMSTDRKAYVITGPTSGIGRATSFEIARLGAVILVGRDREKLAAQQRAIEQQGGAAISVVCDLSDITSVRSAAANIIGLRLPIVGLLNNAGISSLSPQKSAQGWDLTFATNHLGPFALTEALVPHLPDGANVVFIASAVEDPERKPAKLLGMHGGRYISAEASGRGEWEQGGSRLPGPTPTPPRSSASLPPRSPLRVKHPDCISTLLNLGSLPELVWDVKPMRF
jgi:NAD(P)-dependent dehydrogenase (short-subunit alcohol dehydrogenase family)